MLLFVIIIDCSFLVVSVILLAKYGRLRHSHPAVIYLVFHVFAFTARLIAISSGAPTLFSQWGFTKHGSPEPVTEWEIARAVLIADAALAIMTATWLWTSSRDSRKYGILQETQKDPDKISKNIFWGVIIVAFPVGVIGFILFSRIPGIDLNSSSLELPRTAWIGITQTWAGLCLIALIYRYGFKLVFALPLSMYLFIQMLQGYHRLRFVIPVILLCMIYLDRKEKKWPSPRIVLILCLAALLFSPMKEMGKMYQAGVPLAQIFQHTLENPIRGVSEHAFLDEYAAALTLIDQKGKWFLGREWAYLAGFMWIPRPLWPGKPHMAGFISEISTPSRPMSEIGMIVTFLGDAYAHFRYFGVMLIPFLIAFISGRFYFRAYRGNYGAAAHFFYLVVACNLIHLYRDGTFYIITWVTVYMMPLFLIAMLHFLFSRRRAVSPNRIAANRSSQDSPIRLGLRGHGFNRASDLNSGSLSARRAQQE